MPHGILSAVEPLGEKHDLSQFDCARHASLNEWLRRYALINQKSESARTYVVCRKDVVVAYYSLAAGSVSREEAPARIAKGLARHPIPVVILARLAVDQREQGRGLGKALLKDALLRSVGAADTVGVRAVLVHAIDREAREFYKRFGFEESPVDEFHLMLLMKDLRNSIGVE
jgi:GNAT superfamily N-acetyltransferase